MDRWRPGDAFPPDGESIGREEGLCGAHPARTRRPSEALNGRKARTLSHGVHRIPPSRGDGEPRVRCLQQLWADRRHPSEQRQVLLPSTVLPQYGGGPGPGVSRVVVQDRTQQHIESREQSGHQLCHQSSERVPPFQPGVLATVSNQLKDKLQFDRAGQQVKRWIEAGNCTPDLSASFFALLSAINARAKQVVEGAEQYEESMLAMMKEAHEGTIESCELAL